jgi:agmatinase
MPPRRVDTSRFDADGAGDPEGSVFGLPYGEAESSVVIIAVPWEPTCSYGGGTSRGPAAIRSASRQLDLYDPALAEIGLSQPWVFGLHMRPDDEAIAAWNAEACAARGDTDRVDALSGRMVARVREIVAAQLATGKTAGIVGGDHSVARGSITAAAASVAGLGVLHVDAHADLREAYEGYEHSHASVMHNVLADGGVEALVQLGIRDLSAAEARRIEEDPRIHTFFDHTPWRAEEVVERLPEHVWVSFDIDGLDPALCPGTGTPVPGGLTFGQAMSLLRVLATSGRRIVGFDLVEVAPSSAHGEWDGNVGARVLYRLCGAALRSQGATDAIAPNAP